MKKPNRLIYVGLLLLILAGVWGCKSSKKVTESTEGEKTETTKDKDGDKTDTDDKVEDEKSSKEETLESKLNGYFDQVASSTSTTTAAQSISLAMDMFSDKDAPVFIVFYRESGKKDYDKPTTIEKHLNYLKDQKKNPYKIDRLVFDDNGKIAEIELTAR